MVTVPDTISATTTRFSRSSPKRSWRNPRQRTRKNSTRYATSSALARLEKSGMCESLSGVYTLKRYRKYYTNPTSWPSHGSARHGMYHQNSEPSPSAAQPTHPCLPYPTPSLLPRSPSRLRDIPPPRRHLAMSHTMLYRRPALEKKVKGNEMRVLSIIPTSCVTVCPISPPLFSL